MSGMGDTFAQRWPFQDWTVPDDTAPIDTMADPAAIAAERLARPYRGSRPPGTDLSETKLGRGINTAADIAGAVGKHIGEIPLKIAQQAEYYSGGGAPIGESGRDVGQATGELVQMGLTPGAPWQRFSQAQLRGAELYAKAGGRGAKMGAVFEAPSELGKIGTWTGAPVSNWLPTPRGEGAL